MPTKIEKKTKTKTPGIWKLGTDRYLVRSRWTDPKTGRRRKREVIATSYREAVMRQQMFGDVVAPTRSARMRFVDCAERWIEERAPELAASTRERYVHEVARMAVTFGHHFVDAIEHSDVRAWCDKLRRGGMAATTVNAHLRTMRVLMDWAVREDVTKRNPAREVRAMKEARTKGPRGTSLTATELGRFIEILGAMMGREISPDVGRMLLTAAWTGVRKGELLALKWEHVRHRELHVREAVCKVTRRAKSTKTDDPRIVSLPSPVVEVLQEQRRWLVETQHPGLVSGLVFPATPSYALAAKRRRDLPEVCWYRSDSVLDRPLKQIVEKAGLPRISVHSLRRTYEDLLRQSGTSDLVRRSMAGWRTEKAQAIYAGVARQERDAAVQGLVALVASAGTPAGTPEADWSIGDRLATGRTGRDH